jgi:hypothetical protein
MHSIALTRPPPPLGRSGSFESGAFQWRSKAESGHPLPVSGELGGPYLLAPWTLCENPS